MFIILPVGMNYQTRRLPVVTFALTGVNTLVYLVSLVFCFAQGPEVDAWMYEHLWLIPAQSVWYTYLTSMFVHGGFFHLLGNMIYLFLFGCCVEDLVGRGRFLGLYLTSGLVAELVYIAVSPDHFASEIPMGGASGAISACLGAYLLLRADAEIEFRYFGLIFFRPFSGEFSLQAWLVISFWFLKDLFFAALSFYAGKGHGGVAFGAHVGGFLSGLGLVALHKAIERKPPEEIRRPIRVTLPAAVQTFPRTEDESPNIFLYQADAQIGPFNLQQVQQMLSFGSITAEAFYWSEGMAEWRSVGELAR
jgi:membrane associated rhomboid family serine protease